MLKNKGAVSSFIQASRVEIKSPCDVELVDPDIFDLDRVSLSTDQCYSCSSILQDDIPFSRRLRAERKLLDDAVSIKNGVAEVSFPFTKDPKILCNNMPEMLKRAEKQWNILSKKGGDYLRVYNEQFRDFEQRGVIVRVPIEEIKAWQKAGGIVNFISHHAVMQPNKPSTPVRVVSNSSQFNNGSSLNKCTVAGPNQLASLHKLLLRFRMYNEGYSYDLSKCYHTLRTGPVEKFLRLLIWRYDENDPWIVFAYVRLAFGDKAAAGLLESVKRKIGEEALKLQLDPYAVDALVNQSYVDDGVGGSDEARILDNLIGIRDPDSNLYTGTLQQVCSLGGFEVKEIIRSGDVNNKATHLLGDSVLGYLWYTKEDLMAVKLRVNLSKKRRKLAKYPDFSMENFNDIRKVTFTYSKALSLISTQFDPLGIISPWIGTLKVALAKMRTLEKGMNYDTVIPEQYAEFWYFRCEEAVRQEIV